MANSGLPQTGVELVAQNLTGFVDTLSKGNQAVDKFTGNMKDSGEQSKGMSDIVVGALRHIGEIAVDALFKAGQAVVDFGKDTLKLAGDFDQGMQQFRVAAGTQLDDKGFQQFHDLFLQLGKDLPVSTSEVQQAAIEMVKGGLDPATLAAGGLKQNIQFAAAAMNGDLAGAATISAKIVAGWADTTATAADRSALLTHATDLLTKAANASSVDVHELSLGLFNVQSTAKNAGIGLDDVTTVLAELSGDFASSAEAGNSLANFINRLHPTTKAATQAMESLNLITKDGQSVFYDAQGNFVGFEKASELLKESLQGLTNEQRQQVMQTIFQKDAMGVAAGLASRGADGYRQMAQSLGDAMGVAQAGTTVQQGYNTAVENAMGGLEALKITIGEKLLPIMTEFFNFLNNSVLSTLITFTDAIFGNDEAFAALDPRLQSIVSSIDVIVADIQDLTGIFQSSGAGTKEFANQIGVLASDFGILPEPVSKTVTYIQDLVSWFQQGGAQTKQLASVMDDLGTTWQKVLKIGQDELQGYSQIASSLLPIVTKFWQDHGEQIQAFLGTAYEHIKTIINTALDIYDTIVSNVLPKIANWITEHATGIEAVLTGAWQVISSTIDAALNFIEGIFKVALDIMHGDWSKAWEDIKTMSVNITLDIAKAIEGFLNIIAGFFNTNLEQIGQLWQHNWDEIYKYVSNITWDDVGRFVVEGILAGLGQSWGQLEDWLYDKAKSLVNKALDAIGAHSPATQYVPVGTFAVQGIMEGFAQMWPQLENQVISLSDKLTDQVQSIAQAAQQAIAEAFSSDASIDRQVAKNLDRLKDVLPEYLNYTKGALAEAQQQAERFQDPAEGAKYFKMRSDQILEYADLQKKLSEAESAEDRDRIQQQMLLINQAQQREIDAFNATYDASKAPVNAITQQVNDLLKAIAGINLTDDQIHIVDRISELMNLLYQGVNYSPTAAYSNPVYSQPSTTPGATGGGGTTNNSTSNTYNMPIYTSNSPQALLQSYSILMSLVPR